MQPGLKYLLPGSVGLLILSWAFIALGQEMNQCKRSCESDYWRGVSECHRSHTLYTDIKKCQQGKEQDKRRCLERCSQPMGQGPADCLKRCDGDYWYDVSLCYRSNYLYSDISKCEVAARARKDKCSQYCSRQAREIPR